MVCNCCSMMRGVCVDRIVELVRDAIVGVVSASATYFFAYLIEKSRQRHHTVEREHTERDNIVLTFFGIARDVVNRRSPHPEFDIAYGKASAYLQADAMRRFLDCVKLHDYGAASVELDEIIDSYVNTVRISPERRGKGKPRRNSRRSGKP